MTNEQGVIGEIQKKEGEFLNTRQVATLLGVSEQTIYSWTMRKAIPHFKLGKLVKFSKSEVIGWLEAKRVEPYA